jgi:glycerate dehydrogenase
MKIVALDGYTLNPGDLSWAPLESLGEFTAYDRTPPAEVIERAKGAGVILTNKVPLNRETVESLTDLKLIAVTATGYNIIDTATAKSRGVAVCNIPEYSTPTVAQHVISLLMELTTHVGHHARTVREGRWSKAIDWCYWDFPLVELSGQTLGIVGYGRIGQAVAKIARALGMNVIANRRPGASSFTDEGTRRVELDELFTASDVISLHCPLTPETTKLVNASRLALMKPTAYLINTARGALIDEPALAKALNNEQIAGAGLDVLTTEPPAADNPLIGAKNCIITPHIAWASLPARQRAMQITVENIRLFLAGRPRNLVNP